MGDGTVAAGAGAGARSRAVGACKAAARRGAGFTRRGGGGADRGAVTVTSGNVSDIWPQAPSTRIKAPDDASAPSAAACNKQRFAATAATASTISPRPPHDTDRRVPPQILKHSPGAGPVMFCQLTSGTFGNVAPGTQAA